MGYILQTTASTTNAAAVDGKNTAFGTALKASSGGFGVITTAKGQQVFEVLDALPLNRAAVKASVETGTVAAGYVLANTLSGGEDAALADTKYVSPAV